MNYEILFAFIIGFIFYTALWAALEIRRIRSRISELETEISRIKFKLGLV